MKQRLDLDTWARRDHFHFFHQFDEPFFGVTVELDASAAYARAKAGGWSFFVYYLYLSLRAANETEPFRYRIDGDQIWIYDQVHASPTINRPDGTFGFAYMDYHADWPTFLAGAQAEIARVQGSTGLTPAVSGENVIHYSALPWIRFRSLSHARSFQFPDSSPKITFGRLTEENGRRLLPVSVHAHHALVDGIHVGQVLERLAELLGEH